MATNFHPDLPNDQIHSPKDFSIANNSSVLTRADSGLLDWNTSPYGTTTIVTCGEDVAGGLHERNFFFYLDATNKAECHFNVTGEANTFVPTPAFYQITIDINANDSAIAVAAATKAELDRQGGAYAASLTTTVNGTGKFTITGMTNSPDTIDGNTNFVFDNTKTYTGTTVLTSTAGVLSWETGGGGSGTVTAVTATKPANSSGGTTPQISIDQANATTDGYLSASDWSTFNGKQNAISLTTVGTGGASTFSGNTLNIPNYSSSTVTNTPIKAFATNLGTGLWLKNMQDTHAYKFTLAPRVLSAFTLTESMAGACYYTRQGEVFGGVRGFISGTTGQQVDIIAYFVRVACNATHSDNNTALGNSLVTLGGDRVSTCFSIPAVAGGLSTDGIIVIAVNIPGRDNVSFQIQSRLITSI